mmetsp:Transcript_81601/g.141789  ORF Transcript_81601/g.141789 Transcript_81601/m.141789 type:complete len:544 (+) Transcript_81601:77-1708(+)
MSPQQEQENAPAVGAASPEQEFQKAVVVKAHQASDGSQLNLEVNDIVYVLEKDESGWWGGHKHGEDNTGWFPGQCVKEVLGRGGDASGTEPEAEDLNPADCAAGTSHRRSGQQSQSPLYHHGQNVASPQRNSTGGSRGNAAPTSVQAAHALAEERAREINRLQETIERLKEENRQLQSKGEVLASTEREKAVLLEEKWQATASDLNRAMAEREREAAEAARLRQELQREKRTSQVRQREAEEMRMQFEQLEQRLADKDAEMSRNLALASANERAAEVAAKVAAARAAELEQKQSIYRAEAEQANSILAEEGHDNLRRRLFPSTFQEDPNPSRKNSNAGAPVSQYLNEAARSPMGTEDLVGGPRSATNLARSASQRPPERPRTGTSPWRTAPGRSGMPGVPDGLPRMRSTDQLNAGSPCKTTTGASDKGCEPQELPPRGTVSEKVMAFEKRCATPGRGPGDVSRGGSVVRSASNSSRGFRHEIQAGVSAAPSWRFAASAPNTSRGESSSIAGFNHMPSFNVDLQREEIADDGEVVLGMSPLHRR